MLATDTLIVVIGRLGFACLLVASCVTDWRERRIPNGLTVAGLIGALSFHGLAPGGAGLFDPYLPGALGLRDSVIGAGAALLLMVLLYARNIVGAGDTKLMAAVGAFVGLNGLPALLLAVMLAGGALALVYALVDRDLRGSLARIAAWFRVFLPGRLSAGACVSSTGMNSQPRLPFALAISVGCTGFAYGVYSGLIR